MEPIVVGIDGSDGSRRALGWAIDESRLRQSTLLVVHAWQAPFGPTWGTLGEDTERYEANAQGVLDDMVADAATDVPIDKLLVNGSAASAIVEASQRGDTCRNRLPGPRWVCRAVARFCEPAGARNTRSARS